MSKNYLMAAMAGCVLLLLGSSSANAVDDWWNKDWSFRVPMTADAGMNDRQDSLVFKSIDFSALLKQEGADGSLDVNSLRLIELDKDGKSQEVPFSMKKSPGYFPGKNEKGIVIWKMSGLTSALDQRFYCLYFDSSANGKKTPSAVGEAADKNFILPGENLVANGDFSNGLAWWTCSGQDISLSESVKYGNKNAVKIPAGILSQTIPVEPGKKYNLSCWVKIESAPKDSFLSATMWLSKKGGAMGDIAGNYKYQFGTGTVGDWVQFEAFQFCYYNKEGKILFEKVVLPETGEGKLEINSAGGVVAYISDVKLVQVADAPVQVTLQAVEKK